MPECPAAPRDHDFLPVKGHPDDDECTYRSDGTDATYCGRPAVDHDHHPNCYQSTGEIPGDLPDDLCDCRILHALQNPLIGPDGFTRLAGNRVIPPRDPDDLCLTCGATNSVCRCPIPPAAPDCTCTAGNDLGFPAQHATLCPRFTHPRVFPPGSSDA